MNDDAAWDRIVDAIDAKFGLVDHGRSQRAIADAPHLTEKVAYIVFERADQRFKLERTSGPAIVERKTIGARRSGATLTYQNVYDPDETAHRTYLFRATGDDWTEIEPTELGL